MWGCGKKTPPFLPKKEFPFKIGELKGEWINGDLFLKGGIRGPLEPKTAVGRVTGGRIYYARYSIENPPCEGCPIPYQGYREFGPDSITTEGLFLKVPLKLKKEIGFFKIHLFGPEGVLGPPSNRVRMATE